MTDAEREKLVAEERALEAATRPEPKPVTNFIPPPKTQEDEAIEIWDKDSQVVACVHKPDNPDYLLIVSQLMEKADYPMADVVGQTIEVAGYMCHVVQIASMEDGELKTMLRLALMTSDGEITSTCSPSFIKGFAFLAKNHDFGSGGNMLRIRVSSHQSKTKGRYYTCSLAPKELVDQSTKKQGKEKPK